MVELLRLAKNLSRMRSSFDCIGISERSHFSKLLWSQSSLWGNHCGWGCLMISDAALWNSIWRSICIRIAFKASLICLSSSDWDFLLAVSSCKSGEMDGDFMAVIL